MNKNCLKCGTSNHTDSLFCYNCGVPLETVQARDTPDLDPAGFLIRLAAYLIDMTLLSLLVFILLIILQSTGAIFLEEPDTENPLFDSQPRLLYLIYIISGAYFTIFTGLEGQTVGKRLLRLRVLRTNGDRITYLRSLARYLSYSVSNFFWGLGFLFIGLSKSKRGWHDHICDTMVVREQRQSEEDRGRVS